MNFFLFETGLHKIDLFETRLLDMPVRKITAGYCNVTSRLPSRKLGRMVDAESTLERDFFLLLEYEDNVAWYEEQPLSIDFDHNKRSKTYTPDALVLRRSQEGEFYTLYEIKPRSELFKNWKKLKPKLKAAIKKCASEGWKFKIVTEVEIRSQYLKNIEFIELFKQTSSPCEDALRITLADTLEELGTATPEELISATFHNFSNRAEALPVMWRMIGDGSIKTDLTKQLNMKSPIWNGDS